MRIATKMIIVLAGLLLAVEASADLLVNDDLIVKGNLCMGLDCVNNEVFNADTIRLKENNTRIRFYDTTIAGDVLGQSWNISANDSASGGEAYMQFELKSLVEDLILLSDGTAPMYDCMTNSICRFTLSCPIVGTLPAGERITDASCEPLPPVFTVKSMLKLIADNTLTTPNVEDGVAIGYASESQTGAVSVGRADLARRLANVAAGVRATDALILKDLSDYVPFADQLALVDNLNQQLDAIDLELNNIESIIAPPGIPQLVAPANGQTGLSTIVTFKWNAAANSEGSSLSYTLSYCEDLALTVGCNAVQVASVKSQGISLASFGYGMGLLIVGMVLAGGRWRHQKLMMGLVVVFLAGALQVSCGGDGNGGGSGRVSAFSTTVGGLKSGTTYYWKVTAQNGIGATADSAVWSFTVGK